MICLSSPSGALPGALFPVAYNDFRLSLESGVSASQSDQIGKTTLYWTPHKGGQIGIYNGTGWDLRNGTEKSLALGTLGNSTNYDVYAKYTAGALALDTPVAWAGSGQAISGATNASPVVISFATPISGSAGDEAYVSGCLGNTGANGTWIISSISSSTMTLTSSIGNGVWAGGGSVCVRFASTKPVRQDGIWCKTGTLTSRYLGTFRTTATTTTEDSLAKRFLFNVDNQVPRQVGIASNSNGTYSTNTTRQWGADATNQIAWVNGLPMDVLATITSDSVCSAGGLQIASLILNGSTVEDGLKGVYPPITGTATARVAGAWGYRAAPGFNYLALCQRATAATTTWNFGRIDGTLLM